MTGPRYMIISALAFALMAALVKEAGQLGIPLLQTVQSETGVEKGVQG